MSEVPEDAAEAVEWCERFLGQYVLVGGQEGVLSGATRSDGYCWVLVEHDDGSAREYEASELALLGA